VGLVPTMGALHAGHMSLVSLARQKCQSVALTIFVNPTQFGPNEDFSAYPRPLELDLKRCAEAGVDLVFTPSVSAMYPADASTAIRVGRLAEVLCGAYRPGHFDGVATVVAKLFHILPADMAYFGEKDYQQLTVIRRMVRDLDMDIQVVGCPTVREEDGLAMSSRNVYLSPAQRRQATVLSHALFLARDRILAGQRNADAIVAEVRAAILEAGPSQIDYVQIVDPDTLESLKHVDRPSRICLAVRIGSTRLIDNVPVP